MKVLSFQEIEDYLDSGDWEGKAEGMEYRVLPLLLFHG